VFWSFRCLLSLRLGIVEGLKCELRLFAGDSIGQYQTQLTSCVHVFHAKDKDGFFFDGEDEEKRVVLLDLSRLCMS